MPFLDPSLTAASGFFLLVALGLALSFEFVNGFHDTANAVATVIYTHTLRPWIAVVWSGIFNLLGVLFSSGAVAYGVLALLPVELVLNVGSAAGFAMVFALLISAILWNLGTWYLGLPASSSHTLIGSIMGVGLANSMLASGAGHHVFGEGVNWAKVKEVFTSLLVSPVVGFVCAALLLALSKLLIRRPDLYEEPPKDQPPPLWIRGLLMPTCTGVSFAHGSNDGQKGMGLLMLILIGVLPGAYALNQRTDAGAVTAIVQSLEAAEPQFARRAGSPNGDGAAPATTAAGDASAGTPSTAAPLMANEEADRVLSDFLKTTGQLSDKTFAALRAKAAGLVGKLRGQDGFAAFGPEDRRVLRSQFYLVAETIGKLDKGHQLTDAKERETFLGLRTRLDKVTKFIPDWVKFAVALALGLGTMNGWKRIVVTVGEKIGKQHLTYAQGASAELVAMSTIFAADTLGLPVSTTHVLSSGVAGTMAANGSGLQAATLRNILLAWVLTLPVCVLLGAGLFAFGLFLVFNVFGLR